MNTAPSDGARLISVDSHLSPRARAERRWAPQAPANRLARRRLARKRHVIDVQIACLFLAAIAAALILPSWWAIAIVVAAWLLPALGGAWLDTYRPIGGSRRPGPHSLAIAIRLDQGDTE